MPPAVGRSVTSHDMIYRSAPRHTTAPAPPHNITQHSPHTAPHHHASRLPDRPHRSTDRRQSGHPHNSQLGVPAAGQRSRSCASSRGCGSSPARPEPLSRGGGVAPRTGKNRANDRHARAPGCARPQHRHETSAKRFAKHTCETFLRMPFPQKSTAREKQLRSAASPPLSIMATGRRAPPPYLTSGGGGGGGGGGRIHRMSVAVVQQGPGSVFWLPQRSYSIEGRLIRAATKRAPPAATAHRPPSPGRLFSHGPLCCGSDGYGRDTKEGIQGQGTAMCCYRAQPDPVLCLQWAVIAYHPSSSVRLSRLGTHCNAS